MLGLPDCYGTMRTPTGGSAPTVPIQEGRPFALDNGCFSGSYQHDRYVHMLQRHLHYRDRCLFITVPDVVADAQRTRSLWSEWAPQLELFGLPLAYVLQDGCRPEDIPPEARCLFIGGTTQFKLSEQVVSLVGEMRQDRWVHMGRVNGARRLRYAKSFGVDSVDGTFERFAGRQKLDALMRASLTEGWFW